MPISALLFLLLLAPQDQLDDRVRALVAELRTGDITTRDSATKALKGLGADALPIIEKLRASETDREVSARLDGILVQLRREAILHRLAPPVRPVTFSAKDKSLKEVLEDVARQSGVACACDAAVADRPITIDAKGELVLKVMDRICLDRGDLVLEIEQGKLRLRDGKPLRVPTAYSGAFRLRLIRITQNEAKDPADKSMPTMVQFRLDAQPDQSVLFAGAKGDLMVVRSGGDEKKGGAAILEKVTRMQRSKERTVLHFGDWKMVLERGDRFEWAFTLKDLTADDRVLKSIRLGFRTRVPVGKAPEEIALQPMGMRTVTDKLSYAIFNTGDQLTASCTPGTYDWWPLDSLIDLESLAVVDKEGKPNKLKLDDGTPAGWSRIPWPGHYGFKPERKIEDDGKLTFQVLDTFDRDVEFELKDVKLRD